MLLASLGRWCTVPARQASTNMSPISCTVLQGAAPFHGRISLCVGVKASKIKCKGHIYQVKIYLCPLKKHFLKLYKELSQRPFFHESLHYFCPQDQHPGSSDDIHGAMVSVHSVMNL